MHQNMKTTILLVAAMIAVTLFLIPMAVKANRTMTLSPELSTPQVARPQASPVRPITEAPATGPGAQVLRDPLVPASPSETIEVTAVQKAPQLPSNFDELLQLSRDEAAVRELASRLEGGSDLLELRDSLNGRMIRLGGEIRNVQQPSRKQLGDG